MCHSFLLKTQIEIYNTFRFISVHQICIGLNSRIFLNLSQCAVFYGNEVELNILELYQNEVLENVLLPQEESCHMCRRNG